MLGTSIEMLAAVPSIIFGLWGIMVIAPLMAKHVEPWIQSTPLGRLGIFSGASGTGYDIFTAGVVLSLMILPFVTAVSRDVLKMVPRVVKEAGYGMGSTTFEVMRKISMRYALAGIAGAVFLGLGRALGETMAVAMIIGGNTATMPHSLFSSGTSVAATIALRFGESQSKLETSALVELALILFAITMVFQVIAQLVAGAGSQDDRGPGMSAAAPQVATTPGARPVLRPRSVRRRRLVDRGVTGAAWMAAAIGVGVMGWIVTTVVVRGIHAWNLAFFTQLPPVGNQPGGGLANCIIGTIVITAGATLIGLPLGFFGAIYLSEFGRAGRVATGIRAVTNLVLGVPSIIAGMFAYGILVVTLHHFSGFSASVALAFLMLPVMIRHV